MLTYEFVGDIERKILPSGGRGNDVGSLSGEGGVELHLQKNLGCSSKCETGLTSRHML
jgi:hypothetical protein